MRSFAFLTFPVVVKAALFNNYHTAFHRFRRWFITCQLRRCWSRRQILDEERLKLFEFSGLKKMISVDEHIESLSNAEQKTQEVKYKDKMRQKMPTKVGIVTLELKGVGLSSKKFKRPGRSNFNPILCLYHYTGDNESLIDEQISKCGKDKDASQGSWRKYKEDMHCVSSSN